MLWCDAPIVEVELESKHVEESYEKKRKKKEKKTQWKTMLL